MKRVVLVTWEAFWVPSAGSRARTLALARFLALHTELKIVFLGELAFDNAVFRSFGLDMVGVPARQLGQEQASRWLAQWFEREQPDVFIADRLPAASMTRVLPPRVKRLLEMGDIASERTESLKRGGMVGERGAISAEAERKVLERFDAVLAIQARELGTVASWLGPERCLLVPHPVALERRQIASRVRALGFVASHYPPNVEGLRWFLSEVWPRLEPGDAELQIFGSVEHPFRGKPSVPGVVFRGFVHDQASVYDAIDVVINPVRFGAGLKIKSVEALGAGLPLVTTSEGARGLEAWRDEAFVVADDAGSFATALARLIADRGERERLGEAAHALAVQRFSPEACFGALLREIESPVLRRTEA